jgi:hypothetical protein
MHESIQGRDFNITDEVFQDWNEYLRLAIPAAISLFLEWQVHLLKLLYNLSPFYQFNFAITFLYFSVSIILHN